MANSTVTVGVYDQVSAGEITAGTETALRSYAPADLVSFIEQHGSPGGAAVDLSARNETGASLLKGTPVYISGYSTGNSRILCAKADSSDPLKADCIGLMKADLANNTNSDTAIQTTGFLGSLDTSAWAQGDSLWVSHITPGALINYPPVSGYPKKVGVVAYSHASNGVVLIQPDANVFQASDPLSPGDPVIFYRALVANETAFNADLIFDDALYSRYEIELLIKPVTDNVNLTVKLRNATPADAVTVNRFGGVYARTDTGATVGTAVNTALLSSGTGNAAGEWLLACFTLLMSTSMVHLIYGDYLVTNASGERYLGRYGGEFNDTTMRQGISFSYSSGSVASGSWMRIRGIRK